MIGPGLRLLLTAALTAIWAVVIAEALLILGPDWARFAPASCRPECFCELPRTGQLVLQPANAWSSLGFVAAGGWIALGAGAQWGRAFGIRAALGLGLIAIAIGIGSGLLHATLTLWGQFADVAGMYLFGAFVLSLAVARWRGLAGRATFLLYVALSAGLIASLWIMPETRRWLFAALLIAAITLEWTLARRRRPGVEPQYLVLGLALNGLAFALWIADQTRTLCAPTSWLQGHAAWHLLGAAAILCLHAYHRSERK